MVSEPGVQKHMLSSGRREIRSNDTDVLSATEEVCEGTPERRQGCVVAMCASMFGAQGKGRRRSVREGVVGRNLQQTKRGGIRDGARREQGGPGSARRQAALAGL